MPEFRTVLEQKIRERRQTLEEFAEYVETFAREHNEPGTLGVRHLQRLVSGQGSNGRPLGRVKPATARLLEHIFGQSIGELLTPPTTVVSITSSAAELRQMLHSSHRIDDAIISILRDQLTDIRRVDRQLGAVVAHDEVLAKASQIKRLLAHSLLTETRESLAGLLSDLYTLAGWQALDLGKITDSWIYYEQAKSGGRESGTASFEAHAAAEQAFVLVDVGETKKAVGLLDGVRRIADRKCPKLLRAWLAAAHGEVLASDGQQSQSLRAFDVSADLLAAKPSDSGGPYLALDAVHLARWRGHTLARFGNSNAIEMLTDALDRLDPTFVRAETALRVDLAIALDASSDHKAARSQAAHAKQLAIQIGSARQQDRIRSLLSKSQIPAIKDPGSRGHRHDSPMY
jgi:hypothetical protein